MELDLTKSKILFFDVEVTGLDTNQIGFMLRINVNEVEYGFKGIVDQGKVKVVIPALGTVLKSEVDSAKAYEAKLDVFDNKFLVCPWRDSINFTVPMTASAKLTNSESGPSEKVKPTVGAVVTLKTQEESSEPEIEVQEESDTDEPQQLKDIEASPEVSVVPELPETKKKAKAKKKKVKKESIEEDFGDLDKLIESLYTPTAIPTQESLDHQKPIHTIVEEPKPVAEVTKPMIDITKPLVRPKGKTLAEEEQEMWVEGDLSIDQILKMVKR